MGMSTTLEKTLLQECRRDFFHSIPAKATKEFFRCDDDSKANKLSHGFSRFGNIFPLGSEDFIWVKPDGSRRQRGRGGSRSGKGKAGNRRGVRLKRGKGRWPPNAGVAIRLAQATRDFRRHAFPAEPRGDCRFLSELRSLDAPLA